MEDLGKWLVITGVLIAILGGVLLLVGKIPGIGRLPGDIVIQNESFSCVFPLVTSVLMSIMLTLVINLIFRLINK